MELAAVGSQFLLQGLVLILSGLVVRLSVGFPRPPRRSTKGCLVLGQIFSVFFQFLLAPGQSFAVALDFLFGVAKGLLDRFAFLFGELDDVFVGEEMACAGNEKPGAGRS